MIDLLFTSHNRLDFTRQSIRALFDNTAWDRVNHVFLFDDHSQDGTFEFLEAAARMIPAETTFTSRHFGGPIAAMNHMLNRSSADVLAKIDNDVVVCPQWLERMSGVLEAAPELDALGMEPGYAAPVAPLDVRRGYVDARWIGGVGLIRARVFAHDRPHQSSRFFGWTKFQELHVRSGWISPELPVFLLDRLPFQPWLSLTARYVDAGWSRSWPPYSLRFQPYWSWWQPAVEAA